MSTVAMMAATGAGLLLPQDAVVGGNASTPFAWGRKWSSAGYGTSYGAPAGLGSSFAYSMTLNAAKNVIFFARNTAPYVNAIKWNGNTGFGTVYSAAALFTLATSYSISLHPSGNALALGTPTTPFTYVCAWDDIIGYGAKYTAPATVPTATAIGAGGFSPNGNTILVGSAAYQWSSVTGFGTKYDNPAGVANVYSAVWSPSGNAVIFGHAGAPYISAYAWNDATGFGSAYAAPATPPTVATSNGNSLKFSPSGQSIIFCMNATPYYITYKWNDATGFGATIASPTGMSRAANYISFNTEGTVLFIPNGNVSPYQFAWNWNETTGATSQFPTNVAATNTNSVIFIPGS